jgi:hypothetical protein
MRRHDFLKHIIGYSPMSIGTEPGETEPGWLGVNIDKR